MRIYFKESIKEKIDAAIEEYGYENISAIELTKDEYIDFLENIDIASKVIHRRLETRKYEGIPIIVKESI